MYPLLLNNYESYRPKYNKHVQILSVSLDIEKVKNIVTPCKQETFCLTNL